MLENSERDKHQCCSSGDRVCFFILGVKSEKGRYGSMEGKIKIVPESTDLKAFISDLAVIVHKKA